MVREPTSIDLTYFCFCRRKEREEKGVTKDKASKKRKAPTPAKKPAAKPAPKKAKAVVESEDEAEKEEKEAGAPDTAGDEELARALASEGKRESIKEKDKKAQRAKALADIRKVRVWVMSLEVVRLP